MARYSGIVGFVTQSESVPGVWSSVEKSKTMKGDIIRGGANIQNDGKINSDVTFNHRISLIGDAYAFANYYNLKWIKVDGIKWSVSSVEVQRPRIIVSLGGLWNGK